MDIRWISFHGAELPFINLPAYRLKDIVSFERVLGNFCRTLQLIELLEELPPLLFPVTGIDSLFNRFVHHK